MQEKAGPAAVHDGAGFLRHGVGDALCLSRLHEGLPVQARVLRDHLLSHHGRGRVERRKTLTSWICMYRAAGPPKESRIGPDGVGRDQSVQSCGLPVLPEVLRRSDSSSALWPDKLSTNRNCHASQRREGPQIQKTPHRIRGVSSSPFAVTHRLESSHTWICGATGLTGGDLLIHHGAEWLQTNAGCCLYACSEKFKCSGFLTDTRQGLSRSTVEMPVSISRQRSLPGPETLAKTRNKDLLRTQSLSQREGGRVNRRLLV